MDSYEEMDVDSFNLSNYAKNLSSSDKARYIDKLSGLAVYDYKFPDPYGIPQNKWKDDILSWPIVEFGDVYVFLTSCNNDAFDAKALKNYKSLSAYEYVVAGKVKRIFQYQENNNEFSVFYAEVQRSQKLSESNHKPWVIIANDGSIKTAHCTCMSGLGEACSHIAALIFKIERAGYFYRNRPSATEELCKWNSSFSTGKIECTTLEHLDLEKYNLDEKKGKKRKMIPLLDLPQFSEQEVSSLQELVPNAICAQMWHSEDGYDSSATDSADECNEMPRTMLAVVKMAPKKGCIKAHIKKQFSASNCAVLLNMTTKQSKCPLWFEHRRGRFTSSDFKALIKRKQWDEAFTEQLFHSGKNLPLPALEWGKKNEANALKIYKELMLCQHSNFHSQNCGLYIDHNMPHLGTSPDALISCDCCGDGTVEVKCPYKHKDHTIDQCLEDKNFCLDNTKCLKENHKYFYQVQGQLAITGRKYCDFVIWTSIDLHVQRILPQLEFWEDHKKDLEDNFYKYMVPMLQKVRQT